jgi:hypothetical protein
MDPHGARGSAVSYFANSPSSRSIDPFGSHGSTGALGAARRRLLEKPFEPARGVPEYSVAGWMPGLWKRWNDAVGYKHNSGALLAGLDQRIQVVL